jgi:hypothetical protein
MLSREIERRGEVEVATGRLLGFEVFQVRLQKKIHFNRFYRDTQRRDFRPLEDK